LVPIWSCVPISQARLSPGALGIRPGKSLQYSGCLDPGRANSPDSPSSNVRHMGTRSHPLIQPNRDRLPITGAASHVPARQPDASSDFYSFLPAGERLTDYEVVFGPLEGTAFGLQSNNPRAVSYPPPDGPRDCGSPHQNIKRQISVMNFLGQPAGHGSASSPQTESLPSRIQPRHLQASNREQLVGKTDSLITPRTGTIPDNHVIKIREQPPEASAPWDRVLHIGAPQ